MYIAALVLGFTGSIHCVGMCSPLSLAMARVSPQAWCNRLLYNLGRITTYACLGFAAAAAGSLVPVSRYQNIISVSLGVVLLVMAIGGMGTIRVLYATRVLARFVCWLKILFTRLLAKRNTGAMMALGMINGFLPCGLTFIALLFCTGLEGPWGGFLYMTLFGVATLPAMVGLPCLIAPWIKKFQWGTRYLLTGLLVLSGVLLIVRGLVHHDMPVGTARTDQPEILCR